MSAKVIQVIVTEIERRGDGCCLRSPVRIVTQYWSLAGELLAEVDPCSKTYAVEDEMGERSSHDERRRRPEGCGP